jgi:uncharacterized membrane protein YfcA
MGLPTVAMAVMGSLLSPLMAAALLLVPSFVTNVWQLLAGPRVGMLARRLWSMMLTILIGTIAGSVMLAKGDTHLTTAGLGVALAIYAACTLFARPLHVPSRWEPWLSPAVGRLTGLVAGATGVFVIPAVPYIQSLSRERDDLIQALGLSFTICISSILLEFLSPKRYMTIYMVRSAMWTPSIWQMPKPISANWSTGSKQAPRSTSPAVVSPSRG